MCFTTVSFICSYAFSSAPYRRNHFSKFRSDTCSRNYTCFLINIFLDNLVLMHSLLQSPLQKNSAGNSDSSFDIQSIFNFKKITSYYVKKYSLQSNTVRFKSAQRIMRQCRLNVFRSGIENIYSSYLALLIPNTADMICNFSK